MKKTNAYLTSQDAVGQFIIETYDITNSDKDKVKSGDLYQEFKYSEFCGETSISNVKFTEQMIGKDMVKKRINDGLYWIMMKKKKVVCQINEDDADTDDE
jgi:hypothetical protein